MRQSFLICLIFFICSLSAEPSRELLFKLNTSVVKVNVATKSGGHGVGSGVVVAQDHIVTNCHVIADAQGVSSAASDVYKRQDGCLTCLNCGESKCG